MDSWSYGSEGKGLLFSEEMDLPSDALSRSRKVLVGWDIKQSCNYENNVVFSDRQTAERMEFMELGFPVPMRKPIPSNLSVGILSGDVCSDSSKRIASPTCMATSNSICGEDSGSRFSNSIMESNSQDSSLIDLKLGRLVDCPDAKNMKSSRERSVLSSVTSSSPLKRARAANMYCQTPFCQVHGCNMDLSSSKDYHKRHKVCDVHSKTAKVIVNGIEQRFCQQCSRFHLLAEFDDGKRSCRKRLAGHNERRRKPQFNSHSGKPHNLLQSYQGNGLLGSSLSKRTSFVFPDILPGGVPCPERYMQGNCSRHIKLEEPIYPQLAIPGTSGMSLPKSFLNLHGMGKQYDSGIPLSGTKDYTAFDAASTVQELSGVSNSGCALSLLSAQSQNLPSHCQGIPITDPLVILDNHAHFSLSQNSNKPVGITSLEKCAPTGFYSSGINSMEVGQAGPIMLSDASNAVDFEVPADRTFQGPGFLTTRYCVSPEHGPTVDLLQLSSHLQRVEQQRNSMLLKQENDNFCCF